MTNAQPPCLLPEEDYEAIENAVMETERGRWFLKEYARRNRHAETAGILKALDRIEGLVSERQPAAAMPNVPPIQLDIAEMFDAIARTKREIAELGDEKKNTRFSTASAELGAIVTDTERATQDILAAAEKLQEIAWTLRENGLDGEVCDTIDQYTTDIYMACSFQDLTGQRTSKVVQVLNYLEIRLKSMMRIWGPVDGAEDMADEDSEFVDTTADTRPDAHLLNGPQMDGEGVSQNAVDDMFDSIEFDTPDQHDETVSDVDYADGADAAAALFDEPMEPLAPVSEFDGAEPDPSTQSDVEPSLSEAAPSVDENTVSQDTSEEPMDGLTEHERMALFA